MTIESKTRRFIESRRVARLATVDEHSAPHVVPICFALDGDTLYSAIDEKPKTGDYLRLRRLRNIDANPNVQVLFDAYDDTDWSLLRYVQLRGTARIINPCEEHARAIALLRQRYDQYEAMNLGSRPLIAVDIAHAVDWQASEAEPGAR